VGVVTDFAAYCRPVVEFGDVPVTLGVVVVGVDDHLAAQRSNRHRAVGLQRNRYHDYVAGRGRLGRGGGARVRAGPVGEVA
jgi:hypothetical protein